MLGRGVKEQVDMGSDAQEEEEEEADCTIILSSRTNPQVFYTCLLVSPLFPLFTSFVMSFVSYLLCIPGCTAEKEGSLLAR